MSDEGSAVDELLRLVAGLEAMGVVPSLVRVGAVEVRVAGLKSRPPDPRAVEEERRRRKGSVADLMADRDEPPTSAVELFRIAREAEGSR